MVSCSIGEVTPVETQQQTILDENIQGEWNVESYLISAWIIESNIDFTGEAPFYLHPVKTRDGNKIS